MQSKSTRRIRSIGFTKINQLVRAARFYKELRPAFAEWIAGDIYVCKKSGSYRYRFGARSKSVAPWNETATRLFTSPAAFAFAAVVLGPSVSEAITIAETNERALPPDSARANVIQLAEAA
jgi:hypothetical protein